MNWDPPDVWATIILSIPGGIVAGVLVILFELGIRRNIELRQRRKATNAVSDYFKVWESQIKNIEAITDTPNGIPIKKEQVQLPIHQDFIRKAHNLIQRWSRQLDDEQIQEITNYIVGHEAVIALLSPNWGQAQYDDFFQRAREISWLKF